jgi:hypothetical protein
MRFGDDDDAADPLRTELVKRFPEDGGAGFFSGGEHYFFDKTDVIEKLGVTVI